MGRKLTTEEFIRRAKSIHGDRYKYDKSVYKLSGDKVEIICDKHGSFHQLPSDHCYGRGCRKCADELASDRLNFGLDVFIKKSKEIHGDKYDYSESIYENSHTKVDIRCPIHGNFRQLATDHWSGHGCRKCGSDTNKEKFSLKTKDFIDRATKKHGNRFDYSNSDYINANTKILIGCPTHGNFYQHAHIHIKGIGCPTCANMEKNKRLPKDSSFYISKCKEKHGDRYDYSDVVYSNKQNKVSIRCKIHGSFQQSIHSHISGSNCPNCGDITQSRKAKLGLGEFIKKSNAKHKHFYTYNNITKYVNSYTHVLITCPIHGDYPCAPSNHLKGTRCPKCSPNNTKPEQYIESLLLINNLKYFKNYRNLIKPKEVDFYIPDKNIAIEFNGTYYHSEILGEKDKDYHLMKTKKCDKLGINLVHIFESEYDKDRDKVRNNLKRFLDLEKYVIDSKKCEVREISKELKTKFIEKYNIFENLQSNINYGLFYKNRLVQVMGFNPTIDVVEYEIYNFSTINNFKINDGYAKIIEKFENGYHPSKVHCYVNRRWDDKELSKYGFLIDSYTEPRAENINHVKDKKPIVDRIWDCGNSVYMKTYLTNNPI